MGAPKKDRTLTQHQDIKKHYAQLLDTEEFGVRKYSYNWCIAKTADKFYKSFATVKKIVYST